jgi:hypothetical protein
VFYHPTKGNVVADALSKKYQEEETEPEEIMGELSQQFALVQIDEVMTGGPPIMAALVVDPMSIKRIRIAQENDPELQNLRVGARQWEANGFYLTENGTLKISNGKTVIPCDTELMRDILDEAHQTPYTVHPGNNKMYQDLKKRYWWCGMKKYIAEYVAQCHSC